VSRHTDTKPSTDESQTTVIKQELSIHRASFTNFTLVLESIHTCQGREHSPLAKKTSRDVSRAVRPTHKAAHQSQYSVHHSLLQLLKTNCMISRSTVFQVRFWCRFCLWPCVQTHRHKTVTVESQNDCNLTREPCISSLQSNKGSTRALYTSSIFHTLHTRPGIDSQMSRESKLTH
jgi:hypothetical protein